MKKPAADYINPLFEREVNLLGPPYRDFSSNAQQAIRKSQSAEKFWFIVTFDNPKRLEQQKPALTLVPTTLALSQESSHLIDLQFEFAKLITRPAPIKTQQFGVEVPVDEYTWKAEA